MDRSRSTLMAVLLLNPFSLITILTLIALIADPTWGKLALFAGVFVFFGSSPVFYLLAALGHHNVFTHGALAKDLKAMLNSSPARLGLTDADELTMLRQFVTEPEKPATGYSYRSVGSLSLYDAVKTIDEQVNPFPALDRFDPDYDQETNAWLERSHQLKERYKPAFERLVQDGWITPAYESDFGSNTRHTLNWKLAAQRWRAARVAVDTDTAVDDSIAKRIRAQRDQIHAQREQLEQRVAAEREPFEQKISGLKDELATVQAEADQQTAAARAQLQQVPPTLELDKWVECLEGIEILQAHGTEVLTSYRDNQEYYLAPFRLSGDPEAEPGLTDRQRSSISVWVDPPARGRLRRTGTWKARVDVRPYSISVTRRGEDKDSTLAEAYAEARRQLLSAGASIELPKQPSTVTA